MKNNSYKQQNVHYSTRHDAAAYILASIVKQVQEYPSATPCSHSAWLKPKKRTMIIYKLLALDIDSLHIKDTLPFRAMVAYASISFF